MPFYRCVGDMFLFDKGEALMSMLLLLLLFGLLS